MKSDLAVIFDMDGVLVDTYQAHFESWRDIAAEEGLTLTEKEFAATFGRTSREIIGMLWGEGRYSDEEILALDARKEAAFRDLIRTAFPVMAGAADLVDSLTDAGWVLAVGSSGPPENIELVLNELGKRDAFAAVVTGMDVTRGKPDPQVFLIAAERLGIPPQRCAVVEDAPAGVAAANSAGMASIGFASTGRSRQELAEADLVIDTLAELSPEVFRKVVLEA